MIKDFIETDEQYHNGVAIEEYNGKISLVRAYRAKDEKVYVKWGYPQKGKEPMEKAIPWKVELGHPEQAVEILTRFLEMVGEPPQTDDEEGDTILIDIVVHVRTECHACKTRFNFLMPADDQAQEELKNYKPYQPLRARITAIAGAEKLRSLTQLRLYWSACGFVADNIPDDREYRYWRNKDAVDFQVRVALDFRDTSTLAVRPDGEVVFQYKSIALANLKHLAACDYFTRAFDLMANVLRMNKEKFISAVKSAMIGG